MRSMSFAMTTDQILAGTKTVTRRFGWWFLKPGDMVRPVRKAMGLRKGEQIEVLRPPLQIISVRAEPLNAITPEDVSLEGFPGWTPEQFIEMLVTHYKCHPTKTVNRIEFEYTEGE